MKLFNETKEAKFILANILQTAVDGMDKPDRYTDEEWEKITPEITRIIKRLYAESYNEE